MLAASVPANRSVANGDPKGWKVSISCFPSSLCDFFLGIIIKINKNIL
jgi:hypothetical protein